MTPAGVAATLSCNDGYRRTGIYRGITKWAAAHFFCFLLVAGEHSSGSDDFIQVLNFYFCLTVDKNRLIFNHIVN